MYKASKNVGLYLELEQLINYVDGFTDENAVDFLLNKFKGEGLTHKEIRQVVALIEKYLPPHIECDRNGCYFVTEFSDIESGEHVSIHSPIPEVDDVLELPIENVVTKDLVEV